LSNRYQKTNAKADVDAIFQNHIQVLPRYRAKLEPEFQWIEQATLAQAAQAQQN
jgi:hypothetical protein